MSTNSARAVGRARPAPPPPPPPPAPPRFGPRPRFVPPPPRFAPPPQFVPPPSPVEENRPRRIGWHWLLLLPILLPLCTPLYNRATPRLFGLPFFYWFQLACVLLDVVVIGLVYHLTRGRS